MFWVLLNIPWEGVVWFLVATLFSVSICAGMYLITENEDKLVVRYQNFMLERTMLSLKDDDFSNLPQIILSMRLMGTGLLIFDAIMVGWLCFATIFA